MPESQIYGKGLHEGLTVHGVSSDMALQGADYLNQVISTFRAEAKKIERPADKHVYDLVSPDAQPATDTEAVRTAGNMWKCLDNWVQTDTLLQKAGYRRFQQSLGDRTEYVSYTGKRLEELCDMLDLFTQEDGLRRQSLKTMIAGGAPEDRETRQALLQMHQETGTLADTLKKMAAVLDTPDVHNTYQQIQEYVATARDAATHTRS